METRSARLLAIPGEQFAVLLHGRLHLVTGSGCSGHRRRARRQTGWPRQPSHLRRQRILKGGRKEFLSAHFATT